MEFIQAIILGLVQGLAEFLPVSSSGHLIVTSWLFGWEDQGLAFDVALHWGTLIAVTFYFRKDLYNIIKHGFRSLHPNTRDFKQEHHQRLAWFIVIATIPAAFAGYFFEESISTTLRQPIVVAITLVVVGSILWIADYYGKKTEALPNLTWKKSLLVGIVQAFAIIPGVSRSGSTMIAGLFSGLTRQDAARFSFLISIPIIFGAGLQKLPEIFNQSNPGTMFVGFLTAVVSGWLAIHFLMRYVEKKSFAIFAIYRFVLAALIILVYIIRS